MITFSLEDITDSFRKLRRFPLETLIATALAIFCIFSIFAEPNDEWALRTILTLIITFFLATGTTLFRESLEMRKGKKNGILPLLLTAFPIVYGIGFFFVNNHLGTESLEGITVFLLHLVGFMSIIFVAPYLGEIMVKTKNPKAQEQFSISYSNYFTRVAWTKLMAIIVGGSAFALGAIAIGSVVTLFKLDSIFHTEKIFMTWMTLSVALIAPYYALIHFPEVSKVPSDDYETNRFFSFLVRFVGVPAILVYFVILYTYSIRVIINFRDWPEGIISWMVIGFSSFGYLVYTFAKSYENGSRAIPTLRKFFPFIVLPQILMLFYAIYLRIAQYDITMNRYFVVIFGVWLTVISLYFAISKRKLLSFLPASLALFAILISFGPWSVFSLPLERQYDRFMRDMAQAGMMQDGKPVRLMTAIDAELENSIVSEIEYICDYRDCARLRPLFIKVLEDAENKKLTLDQTIPKRSRASKLSSWEASDAIKTELNVTRRNEANEVASKYIHITAKNRKEAYPLMVTGYDFVAEVVGSGSIINTSLPLVQIDPDSNTLIIIDSSGSETLALTDFTNKINLKYKNQPPYATADQEDLSFSMVSSKYEMKVFLGGFSYKNPKYIEPDSSKVGFMGNSWYDISGVALLKKKGN